MKFTPLIPLDSPRWNDLWPVAGDTIEILETLAALPRARSAKRFRRILTHLMVMVYHDCDWCPAAMAIAPHLAALCEGASLRRRAACIRCITLFEIARHSAIARGLDVNAPADVMAEYTATVRRLPELVVQSLTEPWDLQSVVDLAGALVVADGHPDEGLRGLQVPPWPDRRHESGDMGSDAEEIPW